MNIKRNIIFTLESRKKDGVLIVENVPIRMRVNFASKRIEFTSYTYTRLGRDNLQPEQNKGVINTPCTSYRIVFGLLLTANNPATNNNRNGTYLIQLPRTMFFRICSSVYVLRYLHPVLSMRPYT